MKLGERLSQQLAERGWTQADLARRLGVTRAAVSQWVRSERTMMSVAMLHRIAVELDVSESQLLDGCEWPPHEQPAATNG